MKTATRIITPGKYDVAAEVVSNCSSLQLASSPEQPPRFSPLPSASCSHPGIDFSQSAAGHRWLPAEFTGAVVSLCFSPGQNRVPRPLCSVEPSRSFSREEFFFFFFPAGDPRRLRSLSIPERGGRSLPSRVKSVRSHFVQLSCSSWSEECVHFGLQELLRNELASARHIQWS